jgi:receptor protein-tyrosine kinase
MSEKQDTAAPRPRKSLVERAAMQLERTGAHKDAAEAHPGNPPAAPGPKPAVENATELEQAEATVDNRDAGSSNYVELDLDALTANGLVTPRGGYSRIAEEYRLIKRPLIQYAKAGLSNPALKSNIMMITSPLPGEGKTFTSINLAMSMARERDTKVLLIDADLSKPSLAPRLGLGDKYLGFTDLLDDRTLDIGQVLLRTNIPNFSIIPAGRPHRLGTELLASKRAEEVTAELAGRYHDRIIIFDTSPVLATSEGAALGLHVGQIIVVIEAEKTTELEIRGGLDVLSGCNNVMLLLNKTRTRFAFHRYGYYYGEYGHHG